MPGMSPSTSAASDPIRSRRTRPAEGTGTSDASAVAQAHGASEPADPATARSVSFAPNGGGTNRPVTPSPRQRDPEGHALVGVGPGSPGSRVRAGLMTAYPFPITGAKIHPPLLRSDTLSRPRLNDWMDKAAQGRVVLVVAEAGFGKTTFLGDWASKSTRGTAWYRLEPDDADWLVFLRHLVAAGRELDPDFAAETMDLLLALGSGGPKAPDVIATLVREYADFAPRLEGGLTLIFDDYHVIDSSAETEAIIRALIERTGPYFSIVVATRSMPHLPLGRLRSRGGVARLDGEDLCFDVPETDRLFREAYGRPLEPEIVSELIKRTDGWAALLALVRTSLEDKDAPETRALVAQLSATRGDVYDFLAEEVLASLSLEMQRFLTRVSLLVSVDAETGALVEESPVTTVARLISDAEGLGLLSRPDRESPHRFHPLVRDFLLARLTEEIGKREVGELHRRVAIALEMTDWIGSAWHYRAAGDHADAARIVDAAVPAILAAGEFELAAPFLDGSAGSNDRPEALLLRSRVELDRGNYDRALELAQASVDHSDSHPSGVSLLNLAFLQSIAGYQESFVDLASTALQGSLGPEQVDLAKAAIVLAGSQEEGDLEFVAQTLRDLAVKQDLQGHRRYAEVTRLNLAWVCLWLGRIDEAAEAASAAELGLQDSPTSVFKVGAMVARSHALVRLGRVDEAMRVARDALATRGPVARDEAAVEVGALLSEFGAVDAAEAALASSGSARLAEKYRLLQTLPRVVLALRRGDQAESQRLAAVLRGQPYMDIAGKLRIQLIQVRVLVSVGAAEASTEALELERIATSQRSTVGLGLANLLVAVTKTGSISAAVHGLMAGDSYLLSMVAEELSVNLHRMDPPAIERILQEARLRPERWQGALRLAIAQQGASEDGAAKLLAEVGSDQDAAALRELAKSRRRIKPFAVRLTRRLARPVLVEDLGPVVIRHGGVRVSQRLRRKVVGLLCFLSSRPGMSATKDEALEALWPDLGPTTAVNSLHQTIYFLRRVFEPDYREGLGAGYVGFDGEVVLLDPELVDTVSRRCWRWLEGQRSPDGGAVADLLDEYVNRYAVDFAYEEWAVPYRDTLHAAVLGYVEQAMGAAATSERWDTVISLARRVLTIDSAADAIELGLLHAYKRSGRRAAAAEQYAHYAAAIREELGVEPPLLEDI